jgi:hypothetical protein
VKKPPRSTGLTLAVVLGWVWALGMGLVTLAALVPAVSQGTGALGRLALPLALAVATAAGAHLLRRGRWPHLALGAAAAWIAFLVMVPLAVSTAGIALNVVVLGLVLTNLRRFR